MVSLVDELTKDHAEIFNHLEKAKALGVSTREGQQSLSAARSTLLNHLRKEDLRLYPALKKAAEADPGLKKTLSLFAQDMEGVSKAVLEFLNKYSSGGSGLEFARDFGKFYITLKIRIGKEESVLYKEFSRLN